MGWDLLPTSRPFVPTRDCFSLSACETSVIGLAWTPARKIHFISSSSFWGGAVGNKAGQDMEEVGISPSSRELRTAGKEPL